MRTCPEGAVVGPRLNACGPFGSLRTVIRVVGNVPADVADLRWALLP
jgi:hypothetical protein